MSLLRLESVEVFALLGFPARAAGRLLLITQYLWGSVLLRLFGGAHANPRSSTEVWAEMRFGQRWKWRYWLMFDIHDLEYMEHLINLGDDKKILAFREEQLRKCSSVSLIGSMLASVAVSAISQLPDINLVHYGCRGTFIVSIMMSMLGVFFAISSQHSLSSLSDPTDFRHWLSNGQLSSFPLYMGDASSSTENHSLQSSIAAHMILHAPYEFTAISITALIAGMGIYLGLAWVQGLGESYGAEPDRAVFLVFVLVTGFALITFGQMMGAKDIEWARRKRHKDMNDVGKRDPAFNGTAV